MEFCLSEFQGEIIESLGSKHALKNPDGAQSKSKEKDFVGN